MTILRKTITAGLGTTFLFMGFLASAWGQQIGVPGGVPFGGELEGPMILKGNVVCVGCTLDEARAANPNLSDLYVLDHEQGQLVMQVDTAENAARWQAIVGLTHEVPVRAEGRVWQTLTAEENLFKKIEIGGILSKTRMLDIGEVKVGGETVTELEETTATTARK